MNPFSFVHQITVGGYITFTISVVSGVFSGQSSFCVSQKLLENGVLELKKMYNSLNGSYIFNDYDSDDFMRFNMGLCGAVTINGRIGGSHRSQHLTYEVHTDQTELKQIIHELGDLLTRP